MALGNFFKYKKVFLVQVVCVGCAGFQIIEVVLQCTDVLGSQ